MFENNKKSLVTSHFTLNINNLGRGLLHEEGWKPRKERFSPVGETTVSENGRSDGFELTVKGKRLYGLFDVENLDTDEPVMKLEYGFDSNLEDSQQQIVGLTFAELYYGSRPFFVCSDCNARRTILYLDPNKESPTFSCRVCCNLAYPSNRFNPNSKFGVIQRQLADAMRFQDWRTQFTRPMYRGAVTKRFSRFMGHYLMKAKIGVHDTLFERLAEETLKQDVAC